MELLRMPQNSPWAESDRSAASGFRLQHLEVYNWGTFNQRIWRVASNGSTALLTGANGSGKSTLADALLTLFVPYNRRTYNQASGTEKHRERNESTYVRGAWSKQKDRESSTANVQYLRGKDSYSVLLAVFANASQKQYVTLAQVFWWQQGELRKFYLIAPVSLNIEEHFSMRSDVTDLRKQLKARGAEVYDEFAKYSRRFCHLLGLRSEKALDLFNQIVSIKDIGGLNAFVRDHMLQKTDAVKRINDLQENFENLTRAHAAIELAEQQLAVLEPLMNDVREYERVQERITGAETCAQVVPVYIAARKRTLLESAIGDARQQLLAAQGQSDALKQHIDHLGQQIIALNVSIQNDQAGQRIAGIERDIKMLVEQQATKKLQAEQYNMQARAVGLPEYLDEATFLSTAQQARAALPRVAAQSASLTRQRDALKQQEAAFVGALRELDEELTSLQQRKSQIPGEDIKLRALLVHELAIAEEELPFVGELLRVRENARPWEPAIERLLHSFGRQLLIPEEHYQRISHYVDQTNLHGRLIYHRMRGPRTPRNTSTLDRNMLFFKLEVKPDTLFTQWLTAEVIDAWDFTCCETLDAFQQARRALSVNGQVKHSTARHEKDDRSSLGDRKRYVLGWSNIEKIEAIKKELQSQQKKLQIVRMSIGQIEQMQEQEHKHEQALKRLLEFTSFAALNWYADEQRRNELLAQKRELEASADHLAELRHQLENITQQQRERQKESDRIVGIIATLGKAIDGYERQRSACGELLHAASHVDLSSYITQIEKDHKTIVLTIDNADDTREKMAQFYRSRATALRGQLTPLNDRITKGMRNFKQISPNVAHELDESVEAIDAYRHHYERIRREDLPSYRKRFKELLDEKVITNISVFKAGLERQIEDIKESIASLNDSLRLIDYTPTTYIQLCYEAARDGEVREFRTQLRACLPDVSQPRTAEANEASFRRIQELIRRFEQEDRWTAKVTDVRNWLDFSAEERYREDDTTKNYYNDSSGKSGGQKTKLAYTILASAIAYQYSLDQQDERSHAFRFVVIDEAFVRSDEMNARYAMELFKQLDLQLLVVTPLDKIHVLEPYINACHYVTNNQEENDSKVYNFTMGEYFEHKQML
ncbi:MAG TPA: SbcC/MukB-like Walker B domain-containing protein, partial [Ktedonobacteraceae bacterium]|nr:SbcC/MukB-like Walker B domain-containing protein [Ktedonobacteraceae bacterium]